MMLGVLVAKGYVAKLPVDEELTLSCVIVYPIKAHVDCFRSFLLDGVVGEAVGGRVVDLDWSGRLWVTYFKEQGLYRDGLLAVDVGGSDFGFGGRTHHVGHDLGNGVDGAVEARTGGWWLGHIRASVSKEIIPTSAAAGLRFGEVEGVAMYVEDHVTGGVSYRGVGVHGSVVE